MNFQVSRSSHHRRNAGAAV